MQGIIDQTWSVPLVSAMCTSVKELLDRATQLDTIRRYNSLTITNFSNKPKEPSGSQDKFIRRYNTSSDREEDQTCYRCKEVGHVSYNFKAQQNNMNARSNNKFNGKIKINNENTNVRDTYKSKTINCVQNEHCANEFIKVSQIPLTIDSTITIDALPENGSCVTLLRKCFTPQAELGEFPDIKMEINLTNNKPVKCKPYKATEPDR